MLRIVGATFTALLLTACAPSTLDGGPSAGHLRAEDAVKPQGSIPPPVQQIATLPKPRPVAKTETYSVVVNNIKVQDLLFALARDAKLNVDIHPGITGSVTMNAIDQTLPQLLSRIAKQVDMRFELDGPNLAVMPDTPYLKNYKIDYVNMSREVTGTSSTNTQISTSALSTSSSGSGGSGNTSRLQIEDKSRNRFWESLEKNIKDLLYETDKVFPEGSTETVTEQNMSQSTTGTSTTLPTGNSTRGSRTSQSMSGNPNPSTVENTGATVVKRMTFREAASVIASPESGIITVRATSRQHEKVQEFIDRVMSSARRQVLIEATIVEVNLSDKYQQGIDWANSSLNGFALKRTNSTAGIDSAIKPFQLTYLNSSRGLSVAVDLLRGFGALKVLSSPKLTVLNNQTATLKVLEDFVYFNVKQDISPGTTVGGQATVATTTTPQSVAIGFFMSLTAQISDDDTVTLNVRPSISSISKLVPDPNPALGSVTNNVPQIRTREIESMLRVQSGDIVVLGGLMEDRQDNNTGRVPGVGDVPFLGEIFNTRANSSSKSELVVLLRPTVIKDASINGDFSSFRDSLPGKDFFVPAPIYQPFSVPEQRP